MVRPPQAERRKHIIGIAVLIAATVVGVMIHRQESALKQALQQRDLGTRLEALQSAEHIVPFDHRASAIQVKDLLTAARQTTGDTRRALLTMAHDELGNLITQQPLHRRAWATHIWLGETLYGTAPTSVTEMQPYTVP